MAVNVLEQSHRETQLIATLSRLAEVLRSYRYRFAIEAELQDRIEKVLRLNAFVFVREAVVGEGERIDFALADRIGIEIKIKGNANDVLRQLGRYAESPMLDAVVLVATSLRLCADVPRTLNGKPVRTVHLWNLG